MGAMNLLGYLSPDASLDVQLCEPVVMTPDGVICAVIDGQPVPIVCDPHELQCSDARFVQPVTVPHTLCRIPPPAPWLSRRVVQELRRVSDDPMQDARTAVCGGFWEGWRRAMTKALCRASHERLCEGAAGDAAGIAYVAMLVAPQRASEHATESREMIGALSAYLTASDREWVKDGLEGSDRAFGQVCRRFRVSEGAALAAKLSVRGSKRLLGLSVE